MRIKSNWLLGVAIVMVALLIGGTGTVAACTRAIMPPNPWFLVTPQFDTTNLPERVTMSFRKYEPHRSGQLIITNETTRLLYVLADEDDGIDGAREIENMPTGQVAVIKVSNGVTYEWRYEQWVAPSVEIMPHIAWYRTQTALGIDDNANYHVERPANFVVPPSRDTTITLLHGERLIDVPTTLEFALNPDYMPPSRWEDDPCSQGRIRIGIMLWCGVPFIGFLALAGIVWVVRSIVSILR